MDDALKPMTRANKVLFVNEMSNMLQNLIDENHPIVSISIDQETARLLVKKLESGKNVT